MSDQRPDPLIALTAAPGAPAGSGDPSRRWALRFPDGTARFAGITRPEGEAAVPALRTIAPDRWDAALVEVGLAVLLSEGAGPYMIDADGRITLVLGAHTALAGSHVAMGEAAPAHRIGLVRRCTAGPAWVWIARAEVEPDARVAALDGLDTVVDPQTARAWERAT